MTPEERRAFQRLALTRPLDGWFADRSVRILDVSAAGALVEEIDTLPEETSGTLRFTWQDELVVIPAILSRHVDGRPALQFTETSPILNRLLSHSAEQLLAAQLANLDGDREANRFGDETLTAASAGIGGHALPFIACRFTERGWSCKPAMLADQPADGFTVPSALLPEQIEQLRQTYETGDTEARRLTRLLAELSVARKH